jgi:hypothetical protein
LIDEYERVLAQILSEEAARAGMQVKSEDAEERVPAAQIPGNRDSFTVRMTEALHRQMEFVNVVVTNTASNNANVALLAGLPAVSTGAARCGGDHSLAEWCDIESFYPGIKKIILMAVALAGQQ